MPRPLPVPYAPFVWPIGAKLRLPPRDTPLELNLVTLLEQRQTRRNFSNKLEVTQLGEFLWLACRNRSSRPSTFGPDQESRVHPSAGAMHPIHVLISHEAGPWMIYDPVEHSIMELPGSINSAAANRNEAARLLSLDKGVLLGFVAEPGKTAAKYVNHETLVWRDAGVVLGYMSFVAEALGLAFCPLGISGQPYLTDYLSATDQIQAVGLAILGET